MNFVKNAEEILNQSQQLQFIKTVLFDFGKKCNTNSEIEICLCDVPYLVDNKLIPINEKIINDCGFSVQYETDKLKLKATNVR